MREEWTQMAANAGYVTLIAWFAVPLLFTLIISYWVLVLREETPKQRCKEMGFLTSFYTAAALIIMISMGLMATSEPSSDDLLATAKLASRSQKDAQQVIDILIQRGVDKRGVTGLWQLPDKKRLQERPGAKRNKLAATLDPDAKGNARPSREQLCELMRLLIGSADAQPEGQCVLSERGDAIERALSKNNGLYHG